MAEAIFDALGPVLTRWTMGAAAASATPSAWRDEIAGEPGQAELRLLALSGQFLGVAMVAEPQGELRTLPDVPVLALPTLPVAQRPLARRVQQGSKDARRRSELLQFLAARGWTMHPADWMPAVGDEEAPEVYAPWRDWAEAVASGCTLGQRLQGGLTLENWADDGPAQRAAALAELRRRDPDAARALLEAKFAGEGAEVRLRLLHVLANRLSEADAPFLEGIAAADRAPKVKALAASLRARLAHGSGHGEDIAELAGFFELRSKGLLRRSRVVAPQALKTPAQIARRRALFVGAPFAAFAAALGLAPAELVKAWSWGADVQADVELAAMAERSGTDEVIAVLAAALADHAARNLPALLALAPRLDDARRAELAQRLLRNGGSFPDALAIGGGACRIEGAIGLPAGAALLVALASEATQPADQAEQLRTLGLIASRAAARQGLERLMRAGLLQADPRLDMIRLNAALDDKGGQG